VAIKREFADGRGMTMNDSLVLTESTYYILLSLCQPQHGYGIMQQTEQMSAGRVRLAAGTLYGALNALCDKGWIIQLPVESGSRKKEYKLTQKGLMVLRNELERLRQLVANGEMILGKEES
jgi:DNA-binding PadR family transcriptional regulator